MHFSWMPASLLTRMPALTLTRMPACSLMWMPAFTLTRTFHPCGHHTHQLSSSEPPSSQRLGHHRRASYRDSFEPRRRQSRSRSPVRGSNPKRVDRSPSPDKNKQRNKGFSRGAGSHGRSACAICLGRFSHDIQRCDSRNLWDKTTPAHSRRAQDGRIISANGLPLCYRWQRPGSCLAENHDSAHICSGCGDKDHGAQTCPRGEKT
jgi:hypothetical protein